MVCGLRSEYDEQHEPHSQTECQLYDPRANRWAKAASIRGALSYSDAPAAVSLPNGDAMVYVLTGDGTLPVIYHADSDTWTETGTGDAFSARALAQH